jgi:hypothetical protein
MKYFFILLVSTIALGCKKNRIPQFDPEEPRLPAYTEKGFNRSGVLINDTAWIGKRPAFLVSTNPLELHSFPNGDSVLLIFNGSFKDSLQYLSPTWVLYMVLKNIKIRTDDDLKKLNGLRFTLDGLNQYAGFSSGGGCDKTGKAAGYIQFGKVDRLPDFQFGDGSPNNPVRYAYITAGRFEFNLTTTRKFNLTKGRFDALLSRTSSKFTVTE